MAQRRKSASYAIGLVFVALITCCSAANYGLIFNAESGSSRYNAAQVSGGTDYIVGPNQAFTIEWWGWQSDWETISGGSQVFFSLEDSSSNALYAGVQPGPELFEFLFWFSGVTAEESFYFLDLAISQWQFFWVTYSGTQVAFHINTQENTLYSGTKSYSMGTGSTLTFGARKDMSMPWIGGIDEVRIWSLQRSASELETNKAAFVDPSTNGLRGYWRFGANTAIPDLSSYSNAMAIVKSDSQAANPTLVETTAYIAVPDATCTLSGSTITETALRGGLTIATITLSDALFQSVDFATLFKDSWSATDTSNYGFKARVVDESKVTYSSRNTAVLNVVLAVNTYDITSDDSLSLTSIPATVSNRGEEISCTGSVSITTVAEKPIPPESMSSYSDRAVTSSSSVTIEFPAGRSDSSNPILDYLIWVRQSSGTYPSSPAVTFTPPESGERTRESISSNMLRMSADTNSDKHIRVLSTTESVEITNLVPGTAYSISIQSENSLGTSENSDEIEVETERVTTISTEEVEAVVATTTTVATVATATSVTVALASTSTTTAAATGVSTGATATVATGAVGGGTTGTATGAGGAAVGGGSASSTAASGSSGSSIANAVSMVYQIQFITTIGMTDVALPSEFKELSDNFLWTNLQFQVPYSSSSRRRLLSTSTVGSMTKEELFVNNIFWFFMALVVLVIVHSVVLLCIHGCHFLTKKKKMERTPILLRLPRWEVLYCLVMFQGLCNSAGAVLRSDEWYFVFLGVCTYLILLIPFVAVMCVMLVYNISIRKKVKFEREARRRHFLLRVCTLVATMGGALFCKFKLKNVRDKLDEVKRQGEWTGSEGFLGMYGDLFADFRKGSYLWVVFDLIVKLGRGLTIGLFVGILEGKLQVGLLFALQILQFLWAVIREPMNNGYENTKELVFAFFQIVSVFVLFFMPSKDSIQESYSSYSATGNILVIVTIFALVLRVCVQIYLAIKSVFQVIFKCAPWLWTLITAVLGAIGWSDIAEEITRDRRNTEVVEQCVSPHESTLAQSETDDYEMGPGRNEGLDGVGGGAVTATVANAVVGTAAGGHHRRKSSMTPGKHSRTIFGLKRKKTIEMETLKSSENRDDRLESMDGAESLGDEPTVHDTGLELSPSMLPRSVMMHYVNDSDVMSRTSTEQADKQR